MGGRRGSCRDNTPQTQRHSVQYVEGALWMAFIYVLIRSSTGRRVFHASVRVPWFHIIRVSSWKEAVFPSLSMVSTSSCHRHPGKSQLAFTAARGYSSFEMQMNFNHTQASS